MGLWAARTTSFVRWEEVYVSNERGRREVHYYLKRKDGSSDLVVIGKEKSLRHMSYHYAIRDKSLLSISNSSSLLKLRSRKEVIDWLNSIVSVSDLHSYQSSLAIAGPLDRKDSWKLGVENLKVVQLQKLGQDTTEFSWIGSPTTGRKRRRHYRSFHRNGFRISVHDFVYVLAEENKRLVAYLDDMYEDSKGNKMVVVQWFHKVDEVGIDLPHNYNDREIFFSLCLQDLSIECIDGLATVLCPYHYKKFLNEASHTQLEPFTCHSLFDNDDIRPFDITQIKGYWNQEILKLLSRDSYTKCQSSTDGLKMDVHLSDCMGTRPKKRLRQLNESDVFLQAANNQGKIDPSLDVHGVYENQIGSKGKREMSMMGDGYSPGPSLNVKDSLFKKCPLHLTIGSEVEVLSQDSGMRGCWFRAQIIKTHKDKVKVRYLDIKDAVDETNNLEEWVFASRVASPDGLGLRICGRAIVRPKPLSNRGGVSCAVNVGSIVDVWWHDGWWEGIVVEKEFEDNFRVYFPGEKRQSVVNLSDLRLSQEWIGNEWRHMERPENVISILSSLRLTLCNADSGDVKPDLGSSKELIGNVNNGCFLAKDARYNCSGMDSGEARVKKLEMLRDLSKDDILAQLKWKSFRKRGRAKGFAQKLHCSSSQSKRSPETSRARAYSRFFISSSLKIDPDNCKYIGDSPFSSSVVQPLTSLVMSR